MEEEETSNLVVLNQNAPHPGVVAVLEEALEMARSGEIRGVAIATGRAGRCDGTVYAIGDSDIAILNVAIDRVKLRLLAHGEHEGARRRQPPQAR